MNFTWLQTKQSYSFIIEIPNMQSKDMSTALVEQLKQDLLGMPYFLLDLIIRDNTS